MLPVQNIWTESYACKQLYDFEANRMQAWTSSLYNG